MAFSKNLSVEGNKNHFQLMIYYSGKRKVSESKRNFEEKSQEIIQDEYN